MRPVVRDHHLDNLRAIAMLAGVLFHAALAYSPLAHPVFPTADRDNAAIVDWVIWFVHLFRMPLFFFLAGYFTAMQVERRGMAAMVGHRALRIGLPFVLFAPLIHVTMDWLTFHAVETSDHPSPLLEWIRSMQEAGPLPPMPPGTGHLWFLYYLMLFIVLLWVARAFELGRIGTRIASLHPVWILTALPIALAGPLATVPAPHPAPESFLPQFWAIAFFGTFFALGAVLHGNQASLKRCARGARALLLGSILLYVLSFMLLVNRSPEQAFDSAQWPLALLASTIGVWMTFACLGFGQQLLNRRHRVLDYLADASYWTYIVHLPILFAIQYRLLDVDLSWWVEFVTAVGATLAICLLSYELLVRRTRLSLILGRGSGSTGIRPQHS